MDRAVIVSTARTPIGRAYRGAFNNTPAPTLAAHAIRNAIERASVAPEEVADVVLGCAMQEGSQGYNIGRVALMRAGLPASVTGTTRYASASGHPPINVRIRTPDAAV